MSAIPQPRRPVVLLTGASAGLGLSIARLLLKENFVVVLTARPSSLNRFASAGILPDDHTIIRPLDVMDHKQRVDLIHEIESNFGGVDILINNAGFAFRAVVEHMSDAERMRQMGTNFRAPMELIRLVLPGMRKKRVGKIINISSVSGMMAMPTMAIYSASKWALEGASESLWYEVRPWGISVTLVQPGFIHSESFRNVRFTKLSSNSSVMERDPYHNHYHFMAALIEKIMRLSPSTPEHVARRVLKIVLMKRPPLRVAGTWDAKLFYALRRFLPRSLYHEILYRALPGIRHWGPTDNPK